MRCLRCQGNYLFQNNVLTVRNFVDGSRERDVIIVTDGIFGKERQLSAKDVIGKCFKKQKDSVEVVTILFFN